MYWGRRADGRIYIYKYDATTGKTNALPRTESRHLDGQPDDVIDIYIGSLQTTTKHRPKTDTKLTELVARYEQFIQSRKLDKSTIYNHTSSLLRFVVPFYLSQTPSLPHPDQWALSSPKLLEYLRNQECSPTTISRVNVAFRSFWRWLLEEGLIPEGKVLRLRAPRQTTHETLLQFTLKPVDVLTFVKDCLQPDICLMALAGYFFSLRPQETFALMKNSFRAGSSTAELESCKVMVKAGLYGRLAVLISNQKSKTNKELKTPKNHSKGFVACFDEQAAREIVKLVQSATENTLFPFSVDYYSRRWARFGIPNIALKDLRRASLYHLGHFSEIGIVGLRSHARHAKITTTDLYLRRPAENMVGDVLLDLDA